MGGSESLVEGSFPTLLLGAWHKWDVRVMALFSLTLQIVLTVLGWQRRYAINSFSKTVLLFAFLSADWIAIVTLGKLSSSCTKALMTTPIFRTYWAPLLLLHLGGPDSITTYALEETKHWIKHLIIFVVEVIFVIMYFSRVSFLSFILFIVGICKNVEKIRCLKLNNSRKAKPVINFFNPQHIPYPNENQTFDHLLEENPNVLRGYLLFTIMRPDVNDYLSSHNLEEIQTKIRTHLRETTSSDVDIVHKYICASQKGDVLGAVAVALGFTFDVVYTKVALIYLKFAKLTRLTIIASGFLVLVLLIIGIINNFNFSSSPTVDIVITGILLIGAYGLEVSAVMFMFSSDWAVLLVKFYHNTLFGKVFKVFLKLISFSVKFYCPTKRRSDQMGKFDLLEYCFHYKKRMANQSCGILLKITNWRTIEKCRKNRFTKFVDVPDYLKQENSYNDLVDSFFQKKSFKMSRGKKALKKWQQFEELKWSIEMDFDHSIIVWHLATSVCYLQEDHHDDEAKEISKQVSDYMMYLLAMCPALLLSKHSKSFWLHHSSHKLKELLSSATDIKKAASTLVPDEEPESSESIVVEYLQGDVSPTIHIRNGASTLHSNPDNVHEVEIESSCGEHEVEVESRRETILEQKLQKDVSKLAKCLENSENKWKMIRDVWIEILVYAAVSSRHISHIKQLGEGIEFLSLIWLLIGSNTIRCAFKKEFEAFKGGSLKP